MLETLLGAKEAIRKVGEITGKKEEVGELKGRKVNHWSFYLLCSGAAVGGLAAVIAAVIGVYSVVVSGAILFVSNAVGAYYVRKFNTFTQLEDYIKILSKKIDEMEVYVKGLKKVYKGLKNLHGDFEDNLEDSEEIWKNGYEEIHKESEKISELNKKLALTTSKLKSMEKLYANLQDAVNLFSNEVIDLNMGAEKMENNLSEFANQVEGSKSILELFDEENEEFDENNEEYQKLNKANLLFLASFQKELKTVVGMQKSALELQEELDEKEVNIKKMSEEVALSIQTLEKLIKEQKAIKDNSYDEQEENDAFANIVNEIYNNLTKVSR